MLVFVGDLTPNWALGDAAEICVTVCVLLLLLPFPETYAHCGLCHETFASLTLQSCQSLVRGWISGANATGMRKEWLQKFGASETGATSEIGRLPPDQYKVVASLRNCQCPDPAAALNASMVVMVWEVAQPIGGSVELGAVRVGGCSCRGICASSRCDVGLDDRC